MPVNLSPQSGDDSWVRVEVMMVVFVSDLLVALFVHPDPGLAPPAGFDSHVSGVVLYLLLLVGWRDDEGYRVG